MTRSRSIAIWVAVCVSVLAVFAGVSRSRKPEPVADVMANLAPTPPMGWNSWNYFGCSDKLNEKTIRETADAMVSSGMRDAGYRYLTIDDCWQISRNDRGDIMPDSVRFPGGMKALGDYIHARGLKFGIYTSAGRRTCEQRPGSYRYEYQDAATYASWGVDYVKVDWCSIEYLDTETQYKIWRKAIEASGRPMVLSISLANIDYVEHNNVWKWGKGIGHLWRTARDINDTWDDMLRVADTNSKYAGFSGPNGWNDADMLEVGNGGMTTEEYRTHMSLWSIMGSPLIAGNDVRYMPQEIRRILTNREVIAIDQDPLGAQGTIVAEYTPGEQIWLKRLADPKKSAVLLLNRNDYTAKIWLDWDAIGLATTSASIRDVWLGKDLGTFENDYFAKVPPHAANLVIVSRK